jgi:hypothetical protein
LSDEFRLRTLENRVLRGIFGPKSEEETGELIKLYNEELSDLNCLQNIIRLIKSRRIKWLGNEAVRRESESAERVLVGKAEGKRPNGNTAVEGRIIFR